MDPACVSARNCQPNDIQWEDGGPAFDWSIYEGWMGLNIDNRDKPCLQVCMYKDSIYVGFLEIATIITLTVFNYRQVRYLHSICLCSI